MIQDFNTLEDFVGRKLRQADAVRNIRESLDIAMNSETAEIREAAAMFYAATELSKLYKEIKDACQRFIKTMIPEGSKAELGPYKLNHYTRKVWDKTAWEHHCQTDEAMRPLWAHYQEYEAEKKAQREDFQFLDSSIRVNLKEGK